MSASCTTAAALHLERVPSAASRAHTCHELHDVCLYQRQYVLPDPPQRWRRLLRVVRVRGVHVGHTEQTLAATNLFRFRNSTSDPPSLLQPAEYSACVPLVWWPVWGYNVGEFFQNSILPLAELLAAGAITRDVLLAPEVGGWPLVDYQLQMLAAFSKWPPTTPARVSPRCAAGSADGCAPPRCFRKLLLCRFRDVYDRQPPIAPWSAAQTIVRAMRRGPPHAPPPAATVAPLRVFFADRSGRGAGKNGARLITNQAALLDACARWRPPAACVNTPPWTARCELRAFGRRGFRADALAMQEADVLVGTHGAALVNALFMRRGGALLEVRPYNFDGAWPDRYHLAMAQRENATHAFVFRTRNRSLCTPVPPANVSAWNARPLNTHVREAAFTAGLAAAACTSGRAAAAGAPLPAAAWSVGAPLASPVEYAALPSVFLDNV